MADAPKRGRGRPKGSTNKRTLEMAERVEKIIGMSPVDRMAKLAEEAVKRAKRYASAGEDKLAQNEMAIAKDFYKEVSRYCHPQLKSIEHKGEGVAIPPVINFHLGERPAE